jgi:hypothetical protein
VRSRKAVVTDAYKLFRDDNVGRVVLVGFKACAFGLELLARSLIDPPRSRKISISDDFPNEEAKRVCDDQTVKGWKIARLTKIEDRGDANHG